MLAWTSVIVAGIGLLVWMVRAYISRNDSKAAINEKELKEIEQILENVKKAGDAAVTSSYDDKLRDKYKIH